MKLCGFIVALCVLFSSPVSAGNVGGPFTATGSIKSKDVAYFDLSFEKGRIAILRAESRDGADIDCYVYSPKGDVIAVDTTDAAKCELRWKARGTGKVAVSIWNMGRVTTTYTLTTN